MLTHWMFLGVGVLFALISMSLLMPRENQFERRKGQSSSFFRENIISKQIDVAVQNRVRQSRQLEVETMCLQAGIPLKFIEVFVISLGLAGGLGVTVGMLSNNLLLGALFGFAGFMLPRQILVFLRNRRVEKLSDQVGSFMHMVLKRYETTGDFAKSLELSAKEFVGEEPIYSELQHAVMEVNLGMPVTEAMDGLARRTGNVYMARLSDYYRISTDVGTEDSRTNLMFQAYMQYDENRKTKQLMKKELSGVKRDAYIMLGAIPAVGIFQIFVSEDYLDFMRYDIIGQIGLTAISIVFVGSLWFINNKISAPLE